MAFSLVAGCAVFLALATPTAAFAAARAPLATASSPAATPTPAPNGWYWPTDHVITGPTPAWLQFRDWYALSDKAWHVGWDDVLTYKHPVYALAWGRVMISSMRISGYGPGGGDGGAMVVRYRSADGTYFDALYGHIVIDLKSFPVGRRVSPGTLLATLNDYDPPHLHFGIHVGSGYPEPLKSTPAKFRGTVSILMGHTFEYSTNASGALIPQTYGFVDPAAFLRTHVPWVPPPSQLNSPRTPASSVRAGEVFETTGTLSPAERPCTSTVLVECQHLERGQWVTRATLHATTSNLSADRSGYSALAKLSRRGAWRLRAYVEGDLDFPTVRSAWTCVTAR